MILGKPRHRFVYQLLGNVKIYKYTNFEQNIPCGPRVMSIFTKRVRAAKIMLGEALSPFCITVTGLCEIT